MEQALAAGPDLPARLATRASCGPLREARAVIDPRARRIEYWFSAPIPERIEDLRQSCAPK